MEGFTNIACHVKTLKRAPAMLYRGFATLFLFETVVNKLFECSQSFPGQPNYSVL